MTFDIIINIIHSKAYPLDASLDEVVEEGAEVTTVMPWKAGWRTNEAFAGRDELLLESCCSWASNSLCCWSAGSRTPVSWVTWADMSPDVASRLEGLALLETAAWLCAGMTWSWIPVVTDGCWEATCVDETLESLMIPISSARCWDRYKAFV